jgi:hypothetical protein
MASIFKRLLRVLADAGEDAVDATVDAGRAVLAGDQDAYLHLLWQMREDAGSATSAWAGPARDPDLAEKYATARALLDAMPRLARYRARDNREGPLFWAAFYGPLSLVERLIELGADPLAVSTDPVLIWFEPGGMNFIPAGCTPLMMAATGGQTEVVRYLLDRGVSATAVARDGPADKGVTALFVAARGLGTPGIVRMLLDAGADPDRGDVLGFTPAGRAAERGAGDVLAVLADAGADFTVPSGSKSVMELAGEAGDPTAMRALVQGAFGRVLTLEDVTRALDAASILHEVVPRGDAAQHGAELIVHMVVNGKVMNDDHRDLPDTPDYHVWSGRGWDAISAIDIEEELEDMNIGARRFASDGEIKSVLGIVEGGLTPFAQANDVSGRVSFRSYGGGGEGRVALEAFDARRVVVLRADAVDGAVAGFAAFVGPPPRHP